MVRSGFIAQTGDPTGEGSGGQSIWGKIFGPDKSFFSGEKMPRIRHTHAGLLSMVCIGDTMVGSQFFFTLAPNLDSLDGVHCVIGAVTEGIDVLRKFNDIICDETYRPYQDVRITHTVILEDPFLDPPGLVVPSRSPSPSAERLACGRIAPDEEIDETKGKSTEEIQEIIEEKEAKARATILEIVGDLPDADIAPPENVLFVCKLNPVTTDDDLEIIFSRFGKIVSCEVIRDRKTGDSLQYAFIEFADKKSCEDAYFKMDNVLIDDRRIHVDFSQSVSKIKWLGKGKGVKHITDNGPKNNNDSEPKSRRSKSRGREETNSRDQKPSKNRENTSRTHNERNRYKDRKQNREHRNRSRSRFRLEQSPSRNKYDRRRIRDHTPNDKSHRNRDHHHNSRNNKNENKIRDKHCSDKDKKDHKMRSSSTSHKKKCDREKKVDHNVNGKKKEDYLSSSDKKAYEHETIDKNLTFTEKSKHKNRDEKSPGTPPKDKDLKAKIKKGSSSVKTKKKQYKICEKEKKTIYHIIF
ncbi:Peptidyl-prolyl cis-trans isomerase-like 4 [Eumeta japonica]|uniref:Peptidyl-prolyl cis-trans isomerase n=1 Tax=Eumeta variegata TaxID=151549 RepID=A0A4C1VN12_EUMVA|nr:Peptidyl-prolyl cis-trans isomerase-like 4 [Eumeta japonica]